MEIRANMFIGRRISAIKIFFGMKTRAPPKGLKKVCHEWIDVIIQSEQAKKIHMFVYWEIIKVFFPSRNFKKFS